MIARTLIGKTIKRVHQSRFAATHGTTWTLEAVEFTDGSWLRFVVAEGEAEYGVVPVYPAKEGA